ncbi:Glycosyl transferases group 1 [uncultured archaeon]|nr:Glycosyl transferases group 1 [uncultured archaeon]
MDAMRVKSGMKIHFLMTYNLNGLTGTPSRTKTTFEEVSKHTGAEVVLPECLSGISFGSKRATGFFTADGFFRQLFFPFKKTARLAVILLRLIRTRPKIIHCFLDDSAFVACVYKIIFGARVVFEAHAVARNSSPLHFSFKEMVSCALSDKIIVMSNGMKEIFCREYGVRPEKIHVIWGPVDASEFCYEAPPKGKFIVGYGGNDSPYQGIGTILEAAAKLQVNKKISFKLVGFDSSGYQKLPNVNYAGVVAGARKFAEELSGCSVFLSTYNRRFGAGAYPHKLSTYMCLGRPVIASDVSDCRMILEKADAGFIFMPGDADALAAAISAAYAAGEKRLVEMGLNARKFAEKNFDSAGLYHKLEKIYFR